MMRGRSYLDFVGMRQVGSLFWQNMCASFLEQKHLTLYDAHVIHDRDMKSLAQRWYAISNAVMKFRGAVAQVETMWPSRSSTMDIISFASCCSICWFIDSLNVSSSCIARMHCRGVVMYHRSEGRQFTFIHCWMKLKGNTVWEDLCQVSLNLESMNSKNLLNIRLSRM